LLTEEGAICSRSAALAIVRSSTTLMKSRRDVGPSFMGESILRPHPAVSGGDGGIATNVRARKWGGTIISRHLAGNFDHRRRK